MAYLLYENQIIANIKVAQYLAIILTGLNSYRLVMGSSKMDTYVEPEIEEVPGPMDEDDVMMDACGYREDISIPGILDI